MAQTAPEPGKCPARRNHAPEPEREGTQAAAALQRLELGERELVLAP